MDEQQTDETKLKSLSSWSEVMSNVALEHVNPKHEAQYKSIIGYVNETSENQNVKQLATQLVAKFCKHFPQHDELAFDAVADLCASQIDDWKTRKLAITAMTKICSQCKHLVPKAVDILIQLYQSIQTFTVDQTSEAMSSRNSSLIDESLAILLKLDIENFLQSFFANFMQGSELIRKRALAFLASKVACPEAEDALTKEAEELLVSHSKKALTEVVTNDEFVSFIGILSKLKIAQTASGQATIVLVIKSQAQLDKEFSEVNDTDTLDKFLLCTKHTIPLLSEYNPGSEYVNYMCTKMLAKLSSFSQPENELKILQALAEMSPFVYADNLDKSIDIDKCLQSVFDKLIELLPLPAEDNKPDEPVVERLQKVAASRDWEREAAASDLSTTIVTGQQAPSDDSKRDADGFKFAQIEYLMYAFQQLCRLRPEFYSESMQNETRLRLQHLALACSIHMDRMASIATEQDLGGCEKSADARVSQLAVGLRRAKNIATLARDLIKRPPQFKSNLLLSCKALQLATSPTSPSSKLTERSSSSGGGAKACRLSERATSIATERYERTTCKRRSSLQDESRTLYQYALNVNEEQHIRRRYAWFPPSLKRLELVDQFFCAFPRDKIPFAPQSRLLAAKRPAVDNASIGGGGSSSNSSNSNSVSNQRELQVPNGFAYREQQISYQLPKQDIALDYCKYPLGAAARQAYEQFVDKRNTHALDIASVIQIKRASWLLDADTSLTGQQHPDARSSSISSSSRLCAGSQTQMHMIHTQRCRRCLVRFDDGRLAVVAAKFVIGSAPIYGAHQAAGSPLPLPVPVSASSSVISSLSAKLAIGPNRGQLTPNGELHANVALFHPNCFTCSSCKEFLVDLVYCLRDNKLYCLRHYGESLRPRCSWCQELIFSDEYLKAMNDSFHVDHFLCRHCDCNLAGRRYVLKEEKPYCVSCYEAKFANTCQDCNKPIGIDSRDLSYKQRHWHEFCFVCHQCQQSLIDKPFGSKLDKVYCADCYNVTFAARCDGCKNPFRSGSKKMEYRGKQWHDSCFCCCVCKNTIGSNSFIPKNDEIYCIKCYEDKYATRCTKCKLVIVSGGITFRNQPWHRDCFNCCNCNKSLAGQRFTTREVKNELEQVKDTNRTNQPHNAYCIDCYAQLFAKKCHACSQAIIGLGGTRFVTFEDRSWHNDCFVCNDCRGSLVGKGFITDGPDTIVCGDCARAKLR